MLGAYNRVEFRRPRDVVTGVLRMVGRGILAVAAELFLVQGEDKPQLAVYIYRHPIRQSRCWALVVLCRD